jgi:cell division protein FtsL
LYNQLDKYTTQAEDLEIDWRKLQLDRAQASRNAHVDKVAREELRMNVIAPDRTIYVSQPLANQSPASQSAPESGSRR